MPEPTSISIDQGRLERLRRGTVVVTGRPSVFEVTGPGALQCLQGLLTNDLMQPGDHSLVYGALLTPKGMIVVDYWVARGPNGLTMIGPEAGREVTRELFSRQLPPRLARAADRSGTIAVGWVLGEQGIGALRFAGLGAVPEQAGRIAEGKAGEAPLMIARPGAAGPFAAMLVGSSDAVDAASAVLVRAGATAGDEVDRQAARILAGWPELGSEIDEKTLPQEVRYDEIDGVSYTKGCYTGQETVARVHFRGHTNRTLRGLLWLGDEPLHGWEIVSPDGKGVGSVRSTLRRSGRVLGLATIRRELEPGAMVLAAGREAEVVPLPFIDRHIDG